MHVGTRRPHLAVRDRFLLAVGILIPAVLAIALATGPGPVRMAKHTDTLYTHNNATTQHIGQLVAATLTVHETAMYGHDELTALGAALNDMVSQRELAGAAQERQAEFIETLQVTGSEDEGQTLVQRHLQRSPTPAWRCGWGVRTAKARPWPADVLPTVRSATSSPPASRCSSAVRSSARCWSLTSFRSTRWSGADQEHRRSSGADAGQPVEPRAGRISDQ